MEPAADQPSDLEAKIAEAARIQEIGEKIVTALRTCYDPEIPVNIVDLGLVYSMEISPLTEGLRVDVKMTLTAQGCGMGGSIAADAQGKILGIPGIKEADVQVVWEPPWTPEKISPEGRTLLGIH